LQQCAANPAHSVVLLPFAQLLPIARQQWARQHWAQQHPCALLPRFETTASWAQRLRPFAADETDLSFDPARDLLVAQRLLQQAGLHQQAQWLAPRVREAALQLAGVAAAQPPTERMAWAARMQTALQAPPVPALEYEQQIALLALAWAGHSAYASDALFDAVAADDLQALIFVSGLQDDPLSTRLLDIASAARPQIVCHINGSELLQTSLPALPPARLHTARDLEDMAQRTAACVLHAVQQRRAPQPPSDAVETRTAETAPKPAPLVALADTDRALTRRIRALLAGHGLHLRDEPGWKLSTTVAASQLMGLLRACAPKASSDAVLAWLKLLPAPLPNGNTTPTAATQSGATPAQMSLPMALPAVSQTDVQAIEALLRQKGCAQWPGPGFWRGWQHPAAALAHTINTWRSSLQASRPLADWLLAVQHVLQACGAWDWLAQDAAGLALLRALHWPDPMTASGASVASAPTTLPLPTAPWGLDAFMHWAAQVLESAHFTPPCTGPADVVIVPASQLLARPFATVILPGCDADRLPAAPDLPGLWTQAQRTLLGLPDRAQAQQAQQRLWASVLAFAELDLLTCHSDGDAELLPSPLLLQWQLHTDASARRIEPAADPRLLRTITPHPIRAPQPVGQRLPVRQISASSYGNLRACPYRFFALNQLRLQEVPELDVELEKRDFGIWLHRTLHLFHEALAQSEQPLPSHPRAELIEQLDAAAAQAAREQQLDPAAFLPYQMAWHKLREGYLDWLLQHAAHTRYEQGEVRLQRPLPMAEADSDGTPLPTQPVQLVGVIDRIDRSTDGSHTRWLLDYKSGNAQQIRARIRQPDEHAQLLFYAALLAPEAGETVRAAYLTIGEDGSTTLQEQPEADAHVPPLLQRIAQDLSAIAAGVALPALGQGRVCDSCAARGLCRRDFREEQAPTA
ncbi:MAG: PD-(D/E)XK nuclease family protein, partial [Brachymonas sp.]|nr:PD-(D/E)XK nuclease family protein [Brachymonas sp.]